VRNWFQAFAFKVGQVVYRYASVTHTLNRRLQRTNKPFDMFGLYRAVGLCTLNSFDP
jgi:hypothetical protein